MVKIEHDQNLCISCGACISVCPDNWEWDDNGKAKPKQTELDDVGCNGKAAEICPVACIKIIK